MKKLIGPILITILLCGYLLFYINIILYIDLLDLFKVLFLIMPIVLLYYTISALISRIKEIKKGDFDDLSKY